METFILAGFIIGLTSNFHCIGMCGPIAMAIPVNRKNNLTILSGALQYNFGRILTYSILGVIVGTIGLSINTFGILQWLSIATGVALVLYAWRKYFSALIPFKLPTLGIQSTLNNSLGKIIRSNSPFKLLFLGGINGLLPCGMVFVALSNAILTGDVIPSAIAMASFGIGTLPSMIAVVFMMNKVTPSIRQKMNKAVPYLLTVVGILIILRGMNLGIPFISPTVKMIEKKIENTNGQESSIESTVQMDCCHKPD